jgi:ABC-type sulfate transport system permease component
MWAIVLRPLAYAVLFVIVLAPLIWLLYKIIPEGRLKVILFRVRSGVTATRLDKQVMVAAVILAYLTIGSLVAYLIVRTGEL